MVHLAAESHVDRSILDPDCFARTNVMGTLSLLNAALATWNKRPEGFEGKMFYQISTDEVFGALGAGATLRSVNRHRIIPIHLIRLPKHLPIIL